MAKIKMVLFDFNGTLVDDTPEWFRSICSIFEKYDRSTPTLYQYIRELEISEGDYSAVYRRFRINSLTKEAVEIYESCYLGLIKQIRLYPDVKQVLEILLNKAVRMGIVSGQSRKLLIPLLPVLEITAYFHVIKAEVIDKAACIHNLMLDYSITAHECLYVGDMPSDINHARIAGVRTVGFVNPHLPQELIESVNPDFKIEHMSQLLEIIEDCQ